MTLPALPGILQKPSEFSRYNTVACLLAGCIGLIVFGIQPLLFGALVRQGTITDPWVGSLVATETLTMALGSVAGLSLLRRNDATRIGTFAALAMAAINLASLAGSGPQSLLLLRALAGLAEGMLVTLALARIGRDQNPERRSAQFLAMQTTTQAVAAVFLPDLTFRGSQAAGGFLLLAVLGVLATACARLAPRDIGDMSEFGPRRPIGPASWLTLVATGLYMGALVCGWSFAGLALSTRGIGVDVQGYMMAASLLAQLPGVALAAYLSPRAPAIPLIGGSWLAISCILQVLMATHGGPPLLWASMLGYGLIWLFPLPFITRLLIRIDPSRQSSLYVSASLLIGSAAIPLLGALATSRGGADAALGLASMVAVSAAMLVGIVLPLLLYRMKRASIGAKPETPG